MSPTNLPSSRTKPEAKLLLSKDLPVKENSIGIFLISLPFLSKAITSKFSTSPVLTLNYQKLNLVL